MSCGTTGQNQTSLNQKLISAVRRDDFAEVLACLAAGASPSAFSGEWGDSALHLACGADGRVAHALLRNGAPLNAYLVFIPVRKCNI